MKKGLFIILLIVIVIYSTTACEKKKENLSRTDFLMDTVITINLIECSDDKLMDALFDRLGEIEQNISAHIETSDISRINKSAEIKEEKVSDDAIMLLNKSKYYSDMTNKSFSFVLGPIIDLWNIDSSGEIRDVIPTKEEIEKELHLVDISKVEIDGNEVYLKEKGMKIDLGGIAKGFAADELKKIVKKTDTTAALLNLGGDVLAIGQKPDGKKWAVGIQNPFLDGPEYVLILNMNEGSIVTSGDYERYIMHKGKRYHHIFNAETGYPAESGLKSVSVISEQSIDGDALSTSCYVLGLEKGMELIEKTEGVDAIFITEDKKVYISTGIKDDVVLREDIESFEIIK